MNPRRTILLDTEAVQALINIKHRKHRSVVSSMEVVAKRNRKRAGVVRLVVPTSVRVESDWDRRVPTSAVINRMGIRDAALDSHAADQAAVVRSALGVSVTDAHIAAVLDSTQGPLAVVTSDQKDLRRIAAHLGISLEIVLV